MGASTPGFTFRNIVIVFPHRVIKEDPKIIL